MTSISTVHSLRQRHSRLSTMQWITYGLVSVGSHLLMLGALRWAWQLELASQGGGQPVGIDFVELDISAQELLAELPPAGPSPNTNLSAAELNQLVAAGDATEAQMPPRLPDDGAPTDNPSSGSSIGQAPSAPEPSPQQISIPEPSAPEPSSPKPSSPKRWFPPLPKPPEPALNPAKETTSEQGQDGSLPKQPSRTSSSDPSAVNQSEVDSSPKTQNPPQGEVGSEQTSSPSQPAPSQPEHHQSSESGSNHSSPSSPDSRPGSTTSPSPSPQSSPSPKPTISQGQGDPMVPDEEEVGDAQGEFNQDGDRQPPSGDTNPGDSNPTSVTSTAADEVGDDSSEVASEPSLPRQGQRPIPIDTANSNTANPSNGESSSSTASQASTDSTSTENSGATDEAPPTGATATSPEGPGESSSPLFGATLEVEEERSHADNQPKLDKLPWPKQDRLALDHNSAAQANCANELSALLPSDAGSTVQLALAITKLSADSAQVTNVVFLNDSEDKQITKSAYGQAIDCTLRQWPFEPGLLIVPEFEQRERVGGSLIVTVTITPQKT